jgi:hypothetical protein
MLSMRGESKAPQACRLSMGPRLRGDDGIDYITLSSITGKSLTRLPVA